MPPLALSTLARLRLWQGSYDEAEDLASQALALKADESENFRTRGAAQTLQGRFSKAIEDLNEAIRLNPLDAEAHIWRGEAKRRLGQPRQALADICLAMTTQGYSLAAAINQTLLKMDLGEPDWHILYHRLGAYVALPRYYCKLPRISSRLCRFALERLLGRMKGNRSSLALPMPPDLRDIVLAAQYKIVDQGPDSVLAEFRHLLEKHPQTPTVYCHRAEVYLWVGRYAEAREDFEYALRLDKKTRWAYVGLCAVDTMLGNYAQALRHCDAALEANPNPARTLFVYRGEALRKLGEHGKALQDLDKAIAINPERLGAWINLALAKGALGNLSALDKIFRLIKDGAGALMRDVLAECGDREDAELALTTALKMMRGNRNSALVTYFLSDGRMKVFKDTAWWRKSAR